MDGVGAYDHVLRSCILVKLMEVPRLRPLIPFVRSTCAQPTGYEWEEQHGTRHQVWQHEGGVRWAVHNALAQIQEQLRPGEHVFAFLEDIHAVSLRERTRTIFFLATEKLGAVPAARGQNPCGTGRASVLRILVELGEDVWNTAGITIFGTEFAQVACATRLEEEDKLWQAIKWIPDLQCAWQVLVQCAGF